MTKYLFIVVSALLLQSCALFTSSPGLAAVDGRLEYAGKPYRGIGVNYFSLFYRTLQNPGDDSYREGLHKLAEAKIPFARFMCGGFWPIDWDLYLKDKQAHFERLDEVVKCAELEGVGLIPSLFWNASTVPDIVGEPLDQLGNPNSKTIAFIRQYTKEVVTRYNESPAIWAWEFGNEYNLGADLPNAAAHRPKVVPKLKTALKRTARDELKHEHFVVAFREFAAVVREHDKHRILITGNSSPRAAAYHNRNRKNWTVDTPEQFEMVLISDNPDPFNTICVHVYPKELYAGQSKVVDAYISALQEIASDCKKPLFIGEFGAGGQLGEKERVVFKELLESIEYRKVPLAALWVYDHSGQDKNWNVTFANERAYMLKQISETNQRLKKL